MIWLGLILIALQVCVTLGIGASVVVVFRRLEEVRLQQAATSALVCRLIDRRAQGTFRQV